MLHEECCLLLLVVIPSTNDDLTYVYAVDNRFAPNVDEEKVEENAEDGDEKKEFEAESVKNQTIENEDKVKRKKHRKRRKRRRTKRKRVRVLLSGGVSSSSLDVFLFSSLSSMSGALASTLPLPT